MIRIIFLFSGQSVVESHPPLKNNCSKKTESFVQNPPELVWAANAFEKMAPTFDHFYHKKGAINEFDPLGLLIIPVSIADIGVVSESKLLEKEMQTTPNDAISFSSPTLFASHTAHFRIIFSNFSFPLFQPARFCFCFFGGRHYIYRKHGAAYACANAMDNARFDSL